MKLKFYISLLLAILTGLSISLIDSGPGWDDTGITVFLVLLSAFIWGFFSSKKPWLIALVVSIWIPVFGLISSQNIGGIFALIPGFLGAYSGYLIRTKIFNYQ